MSAVRAGYWGLTQLAMMVIAAPWAGAAVASTQPSVDPMAWFAPATLPPLRERLDRKQFDAQFTAEDAQLDKAILNLPDPPLVIDDKPSTATDWFPARAFANGGSRSPKWDSLMLVACRVWKENPALAETALLHAQQAGYHGWVLEALEARMALRELRFDATLAYGLAALADAPADRKPVVADWIFTAAMLDYKLEVAALMFQQYPALEVDKNELPQLQRLITMARATPHVWPTPAMMAAGIVPSVSAPASPRANKAPAGPLAPVDLTREIQPMHVGGDTPEPNTAKVLRKGAILKLAAPGEKYQMLGFGPTAANSLLCMHIKLNEPDHRETFFDRGFVLKMIDAKHPKLYVVEVELLAENGLVVNSIGGFDDVAFLLGPSVRWKPSGADLRVVVLDHDCEITLDGRRIFYGPFPGDPQSRRIYFALQASGARAEITHLTWTRLQSPGRH